MASNVKVIRRGQAQGITVSTGVARHNRHSGRMVHTVRVEERKATGSQVWEQRCQPACECKVRQVQRQSHSNRLLLVVFGGRYPECIVPAVDGTRYEKVCTATMVSPLGRTGCSTIEQYGIVGEIQVCEMFSPP